MHRTKIILLSFFTLVTIFSANAQKKKATTSKKTIIKKSELPVLKTYLGGYSDTATVSAQELFKLIDSPIRVTDKQNNLYTITYYQFLFKRRVMSEDETTGKPFPTTSMISDNFKATPLPKVWIDNIRQDIKPGEEMLFFDIIVKDSKGVVMYAPNLKILTK
jgi:hypothetical protein